MDCSKDDRMRAHAAQPSTQTCNLCCCSCGKVTEYMRLPNYIYLRLPTKNEEKLTRILAEIYVKEIPVLCPERELKNRINIKQPTHDSDAGEQH